MNISIQDLKDAGLDEDLLVEGLLENQNYRNQLMTVFKFPEDMYGEFGASSLNICSCFYGEDFIKKPFIPEIVFQVFVKYYLGRNFYSIPNILIAGDAVDDLSDVSYQLDLISNVINTHKDSINNPEKFFLAIFKDLILSEELAKFVTLDENKLKEQKFFTDAMSSYEPLKKISSLFYEEILKLYQSKKA